MPFAVSFFGAASTQGSQFLGTIEQKIEFSEFGLLRTEGGFTGPNDFPIEEVIRVIQDHEFPRENFYEYEWAIYECEFDRVRNHSPWMQTFLSSLYVYCNKRKQWGSKVESDYFYLVVLLALNEKEQQEELLRLYLSFIEWLYDHVEPDVGYNDYYCLLTWTLLRRLSGSTEDARFKRVVERLLDQKYSREDIASLTVSDRGVETWHELHHKISCPEPLKEDFNRIILGLPM